jgi:RimJ/RimL family protein N-acetyltransferase
MMDLGGIELPALTDGSLVLRSWRPDDAAGVAAMCDDPSVASYIPVPSPYTLADGEDWVGDAARKWREDHWAQFAVTRRETGELVASCGVKIDVERHSGEIGYLVKKEARRTGVASGAVRLLVAWGFDELGLGRLQIRADPSNTGSRRTIEACGFQYEGVLRAYDVIRGQRIDDVIYSLLPGDPRAGR